MRANTPSKICSITRTTVVADLHKMVSLAVVLSEIGRPSRVSEKNTHRSSADGQDQRRIHADQCALLKLCITDQFGEENRIFHLPPLFLGDDNPGVLQRWVRDGIRIYRIPLTETDREVLLVCGRNGEDLIICSLDVESAWRHYLPRPVCFLCCARLVE